MGLTAEEFLVAAAAVATEDVRSRKKGEFVN